MHPSWPDRSRLEALAGRLPDLIRFGTSSWTYPGWTGLVAWPDDQRAVGIGERWSWGAAVNLQELNIGVKEWIGTAVYRLTGRMVAARSDDGRVVCGDAPDPAGAPS